MNFAGFNDWFEIFKGGEQTDSAGRPHSGDALIRRVMDKFTPGKPKLVIDHPEIEAPALGAVERLKTEVKGGVLTLMAKAGGVAPELAGLQKKGFFTGRSIGIAPDGSLDHVGFLYGYNPAVKGLAGLEFNQPTGSLNFYSQLDDGGDVMELSQITEFIKGLGLKIVPDKTAPVETTTTTDADSQFSEADLEAAKKKAADEAADKAKKDAETEFAAKEAKAASDAAKAEIGDWVKGLIADGKLPPAMTAGMAEFSEALVEVEKPIQFSKGDDGDDEELDVAAWFKNFCGQLQESPLFAEFATKERAGKGSSVGVTWNSDLDDKV